MLLQSFIMSGVLIHCFPCPREFFLLPPSSIWSVTNSPPSWRCFFHPKCVIFFFYSPPLSSRLFFLCFLQIPSRRGFCCNPFSFQLFFFPSDSRPLPQCFLPQDLISSGLNPASLALSSPRSHFRFTFWFLTFFCFFFDPLSETIRLQCREVFPPKTPSFRTVPFCSVHASPRVVPPAGAFLLHLPIHFVFRKVPDPGPTSLWLFPFWVSLFFSKPNWFRYFLSDFFFLFSPKNLLPHESFSPYKFSSFS